MLLHFPATLLGIIYLYLRHSSFGYETEPILLKSPIAPQLGL